MDSVQICFLVVHVKTVSYCMYRKKINNVLFIIFFYARAHFCCRLTTSANSLASDQARMEFLVIFLVVLYVLNLELAHG